MGGFGHTSQHDEQEDPVIIARRSQLALRLFAFYCAFYASFMYLTAFQPKLMEWTPLLGVNLAIWFGLGLIIGALVLALLYALLCRRLEEQK